MPGKSGCRGRDCFNADFCSVMISAPAERCAYSATSAAYIGDQHWRRDGAHRLTLPSKLARLGKA
jgi:hypothetical protein